MPIAAANGIKLAYETFGDPADPPLLLVMGLGAQMTVWDEAFCRLIAERGFHVIRFDNRDVGQSTWIDTPNLDIGGAVMAAVMGDLSQAPYLLSDMAADAVGLLDELGIRQAHIVGASMGGMIAQTIAIEHPDRVLSLASIMSTTGDPDVGQPSPELATALLTPTPNDREGAVEANLATARLICHPDHFDEAKVRARLAGDYDRGFNPAGVGRQLLAIIASGSRAEGLQALKVPTLVIHGKADPLVPYSGGERTAALVPGAELLSIDDMAHDLPEAHWSRMADAIAANAAAAN